MKKSPTKARLGPGVTFMLIKTIAVIGAGQMGAGIAQFAACAGYEVIVQDVFREALPKAKKRIEQNLQRLFEKGKIAEAERSVIGSRIRYTEHLEEISSADLVIEAVSENQKLKLELFRKIDSICHEDTILASNTSSISITAIAAQTRRPDRVVGLHFMNPVPLMKLVEIIKGVHTSQTTFEAVRCVCEKAGKVIVESKDYPGFIVNRILLPMINEACFALYEGVASVEDIDCAMKLGTNQPMGPLALADLIGLDTCLSILNVLHEGLGDPKYRPCPLLKQYVSAGRLGKKVGCGFYVYEPAPA